MVKLSHIDSSYCGEIKELPSSIRYLINLNFLRLKACSDLEKIPNSICELKNLKSLFLDECPKLKKLPEGFGSLKNLQELDLCSYAKLTNMHAFTSLCSLRKLDLRFRQIGDEGFPKNLHGLSSLEILILSGNPVTYQHISSFSTETPRIERLVPTSQFAWAPIRNTSIEGKQLQLT
ncbi:hypothetical protein L1987_39639 [Smallanthus sonchifolius]|uniref:Uncharacterized protein n=1 Tax=Smallanthus sonchifolius TaxID=185202 RepID=A0ACB9HMU9_9ASTR|nr:hypothetical protein L1987_39639 [Smallanthus sonchifolius]